ncbi:hypothetical protein [Methylosinus sp. KRF6]|uniref:hypothetical protein n=1 Tax=Methylosinus sp. KRF6 TaxID=2846853 RepID=UPI001C0D77E0|nr:hypothetical protein [Methylosinus sp. KRF6]MBU3888513.1 hypothetical protein [Methylosinus sp. KRF6]
MIDGRRGAAQADFEEHQCLAPLRCRHARLSFEIHPTNGIEDILRGDADIARRARARKT